MIRFLVASTCLFACLVACAVIASRFTITLTIRPSSSISPEPPHENMSVQPPVDVKPATKRVDSHHTKGA